MTTANNCSAQPIGICLVAGNRLLREVLTRLLKKRCDLRMLGVVPLARDMVALVAAHAPDVLLLDSPPPDLLELGVIREARRLLPEVKVVMTGMAEDRETFLHAVREGVVGYLLKDASAPEVAGAVRAVMRGEAVCPPGLCLTLFDYVAQVRLSNSGIERHLGFTRREHELVRMIGRGLTNKEIASQLNLSEQTVKNHVHRMLRKAGASDRMSLAQSYHEQCFGMGASVPTPAMLGQGSGPAADDRVAGSVIAHPVRPAVLYPRNPHLETAMRRSQGVRPC